MATRVVIEKSCDICNLTVGENDSRIITSVALTFGKGEYEVDACEKCFDENPFTKNMRAVKRTYSKKQNKKAGTASDLANPVEAADEDMSCGFKGCDYVAPRKQSLSTHRTKADHWGKR
jgi:hypothetical protein